MTELLITFLGIVTILVVMTVLAYVAARCSLPFISEFWHSFDNTASDNPIWTLIFRSVAVLFTMAITTTVTCWAPLVISPWYWIATAFLAIIFAIIMPITNPTYQTNDPY